MWVVRHREQGWCQFAPTEPLAFAGNRPVRTDPEPAEPTGILGALGIDQRAVLHGALPGTTAPRG